MSYGRPYDQPERALIARNQRAGVPLGETARQLGRGYAGVKSFASDAGHLQPRRSLTAEQRAQAFRMREQGFSSAQIGAELGRPASSVRKLFMRRAP